MARSDEELEQLETDPEAWVTVRRFIAFPEAEMAQSALESASIETFLADENANRLLGFGATFMGGVRLQVQKKDAETARNILDEQAGELPEGIEEAHNEGSDGL